jgi:carbonic anhydrase
MELKQIFENNKNWAAKKTELDKNYFENLAKGQTPKILYIGCADSRVTAESLMGVEPGEVFVHRNVANVVSNLDINSASVINYAVKHLKVENVVICGHYECGGVKAAMSDGNFDILNPWLNNIKDVYRLHKEELESITDEDERYNRLIELNIQEQCVNLYKHPEVQEAYEAGKLNILGWVFDIKTGKLIDLELNIKSIMEPIKNIFAIN